MENQPKLNTSKEVISYLVERFPQCFIAEGEARPLKIGIFKELAERLSDDGRVSKTQLRSALRIYTSSWRYLYGVKTGAKRVDLDGNSCGDIEIEHVEHARKQLEEAKARVKERRLAQQAVKSESEPESVNRVRPPKKNKFIQAKFTSTEKSQPLTSSPPSRPAQQVKEKELVTTPVKVVKQKKTVSVADIALLQIGQAVKVKAGTSLMDATVLEVARDGVRIQLSSGLAMSVRAEHLQF